MATTKRATGDGGRQLTIPIIQVVDTVKLSDDGTTDPITAAFTAAGQYIAEGCGGERDVHLEFAFEGMEFQAIYHGRPEKIDLERMD